MRAADPNRDPSAVPVSEHQHWAEASWPGPNPQNQLPELKTGTEEQRKNSGIILFVTLGERRKEFYQSSMCVACATGCAAARGRLLVMVGVCEHQTLRGSGARRLSSSGARLLKQRSEVQTNTPERPLVKSHCKGCLQHCRKSANSIVP